FPAVWLRDQWPGNRYPGTGQRTIGVADLPENPEILSVSHIEDTLAISWTAEPAVTVLALDWLRSLLDPPRRQAILWTAREGCRCQWTSYTAFLQEDRARWSGLRR